MWSILMLQLLIMAKEKKFTKKSKSNLLCKILINIIIHVHNYSTQWQIQTFR